MSQSLLIFLFTACASNEALDIFAPQPLLPAFILCSLVQNVLLISPNSNLCFVPQDQLLRASVNRDVQMHSTTDVFQVTAAGTFPA